jgi:uncharacterized protein
MPPADDPMDDDLERRSRDQLIAEVRKLRRGIREHRDSTRHELCWYHPALWRLLPEQTDPLPVVPSWPEFLRGCVRYRQSLDEQAPAAPRTDDPYWRPAVGYRAGAEITEGLALWHRLDVPGHDACRLLREDGGWRLEGTAVHRHEQGPVSLAYEVECDSRWRTLRGWVRGSLGGRAIVFHVSQSGGGWRSNGAPIAGLTGCVDLDLGFTPATNLIAIRRLALAQGQAADVRSAWLDVATGSLQPLEQRYERRGESTYWYEAPHFNYAAELDVGPVGFVRRYPGLWEVEPDR